MRRPRSPREDTIEERSGPERLTGNSRAITRVVEQIRHIASTRATVLIEGEAGSGKSLAARAIHEGSGRAPEGFTSADCAALPEALIETELFGEERGASAPAGPPRKGRFEQAHGGTLLLEQIGRAPAAVQLKLLRWLQNSEFERVGGQDTIRADVRLVASTPSDLTAEVGAGRFREDLLSRLSAVRIVMPPLRDRREDMPLLVESFIREFNREHGRRVTGASRGLLERLERHDWPGNVRQLRSVLEAMMIPTDGRRTLELSDLPASMRAAVPDSERMELVVGMTGEEAERRLIEATLRQVGFDKPQAAAILGIGLRTLYRKIQKYRIG